MMTREEIIHEYEDAVAAHAAAAAAGIKGAEKSYELFKAGLSALRPVSREQVEKVWRGEWKIIEYEFFTCSRCGDSYYNGAESHGQAESYLNSGYVYDFCPHCGSANTDKAVQMVMERLEVLKDGL